MSRVLIAALSAVLLTAAGVSAQPSATEANLDRQAYLIEKPHLRPNLPEAKILASVTAKLQPVLERIYGTPFQFDLTGERDPDAYSYYGPHIYVSRGMVDFADSREELTGVLCHEASHVLHHDGTRSDRATQVYNNRVRAIINRAEKVTHNHFKKPIAKIISAGGTLATLHYSRGEEEAADLSGATVCSESGSNPWGIVWMLGKLRGSGPSSRIAWFSDHPTDKTRIAALSKYLRRHAEFATWSSDPTLASTPLHH